MGNFSSQYEDYYRNIKKRTNIGYSNYNLDKKNNKSFLSKRFIRDLVGVFILLLFVISCKLIITPETKAVYNYSKKLVNQHYDYKVLLQKVNKIDLNNIQKKAVDYIENIKRKITGKETVKDKIKGKVILPVKGKITSDYGYRKDPFTGTKKFHKGIDISIKENSPIKACYKGKIKDCGQDEQFGKYILIDHGEGIESKYGHLNDILVKKGEKVTKGKIIGNSGNTGKSTGPHLHFELLYMGENQNPQEYFNNIN